MSAFTRRLLTGLFLPVSLAAGLAACGETDPGDGSAEGIPGIPAALETPPVDTDGDAADDPAIFIPPGAPERAIILGTAKKSGLFVYDLNGEQLQFLPVGNANNVDVRNGFELEGETLALAAATNRTTNAISVFTIDPASLEVSEVEVMPHELNYEEPYGLCLFDDPDSEKFFAFVGDKTGQLSQWELRPTSSGRVAAIKVREMNLPSQSEGCVVDDANSTLYIAEEAGSVWVFDAAPDAQPVPRLLFSLPEEGSGETSPLQADFEGVALFEHEGEQYLLLSSQGNNRYAAISTRTGNLSATFAVSPSILGETVIDGVAETDGLDVTTAALGEAFPNGLMVVQDGFNTDPDDKQNFKYVDWGKVLEAITLSPYPAASQKADQ